MNKCCRDDVKELSIIERSPVHAGGYPGYRISERTSVPMPIHLLQEAAACLFSSEKSNGTKTKRSATTMSFFI